MGDGHGARRAGADDPPGCHQECTQGNVADPEREDEERSTCVGLGVRNMGIPIREGTEERDGPLPAPLGLLTDIAQVMEAMDFGFRDQPPLSMADTARRSLQNPAAEREIRVVLISVNCKTTIQLYCKIYEFITSEVRLSVQAPGGPEYRRFGTGRAAENAIFVC